MFFSGFAVKKRTFTLTWVWRSTRCTNDGLRVRSNVASDPTATSPGPAAVVYAKDLPGMLAFYAARLVWLSWLTHDVSPASDATPLWIPQLAMALGCIGLAVGLLDAALSRASGIRFELNAGAETAHVE